MWCFVVVSVVMVLPQGRLLLFATVAVAGNVVAADLVVLISSRCLRLVSSNHNLICTDLGGTQMAEKRGIEEISESTAAGEVIAL